MDWKYEYGNNEGHNTSFNQIWIQMAAIVIVKAVKHIKCTILPMFRRLKTCKNSPFSPIWLNEVIFFYIAMVLFSHKRFGPPGIICRISTKFCKIELYRHHFELNDYIVLKYCHHIHPETVHLYSKFNDDIFLLNMNFHCQTHNPKNCEIIWLDEGEVDGKLTILRHAVIGPFYLFWCATNISKILYMSYESPGRTSEV